MSNTIFGNVFGKYFKLMALFASASISAQLEYRFNFVVNTIGSILLAVTTFFGLGVLYGNGKPLGGWSFTEASVVVGLFLLVEGFMGAFLAPNLNKIGEGVRTGSLDFILLKPLDAQFLVSSRNINIFRLPDSLVGIGVVIWALVQLPDITLGGVLLGVALMVCGLVIVYGLWLMLATTAFWFVRVENMTELVWSLFRAGQFPVTVLPPVVRLFLTFVVPVAFISTVPAEAMIGRIEPINVVLAVVVALVVTLVSRWFWRFALRSYTSASS
jgi:ABC-2 type transport system permease protein